MISTYVFFLPFFSPPLIYRSKWSCPSAENKFKMMTSLLLWQVLYWPSPWPFFNYRLFRDASLCCSVCFNFSVWGDMQMLCLYRQINWRLIVDKPFWPDADFIWIFNYKILSLLINHYIQFRKKQAEEQECAAAHMQLFFPDIEFCTEKIGV